MIVDTSALVAILRNESDAPQFARILANSTEASLSVSPGVRVYNTTLSPVLVAAVPNERQQAFIAHMGKMGLAWA